MLKSVDAIRLAGASGGHTAVIFICGIFPETEKNLSDHGVQLQRRSTRPDGLAAAKDRGSFDMETLAEVKSFLAAPRNWQAARGD